MTSRTRNGLILAALLVLAGGALLIHQVRSERQLEKFQQTFPIMGTLAGFTFYAEPEQSAAAAEAARAAFDRVTELANLYNPESELARLNRSAANSPFVCSDELWLMLSEARQAYEFSGGAFDITAKPLMDLWGFYRRRGDALPTAAETAAARARVGLEKVIFDDEKQTVKFTVPGMAFDLGGIAKGYAVDAACDAAVDCGVRRGIVDLGGNLRLMPLPPPGKLFYRVGIRDPRDRHAVLPEVIELRNAALSTSGDYERFVTIGGKRYGHIMDPVAGHPTQQENSVTVIAPSAMLADWLSTTLFLRPELADRAEREFPGVQVVIAE